MRMRKDAKLELLRQVPLFAGCSKKELGEISTLADELSLPAGTKLIEEGRQGHEFFLLVDGTVDVSAKGRESKTARPRLLLRRDGARLEAVRGTRP